MKPTLLILAAGMGSRYGGLKQIDPIGPNGETIIDYSIYDAIEAGFGKIVFVIRKSFADIFKEKIGSKFDNKIQIEYAFQELDSCIGDYQLNPERQKPWGTGHAILVAKDLINEPFGIINADDFYGKSSYKILSDYLTESANSEKATYSMVGYKLCNTLSEFGSVSRGICQSDEDMNLLEVVERTKIEKAPSGAKFTDENGKVTELTGEEIVSMNMWGFMPNMFDYLEAKFATFLEEKGSELKSEFFIPSVVAELIKSGEESVKVLKTEEKWFGVTYKEDKANAQAMINKLIEADTYPANIWS